IAARGNYDLGQHAAMSGKPMDYFDEATKKKFVPHVIEPAVGVDFYDAKVKVLQEQIEHHVEEEEKSRGNLFQQARAADVDLEALGRQMAARKEELMKFADAEGLPPAQPATMDSEA
ncbi:MAG TPA: hypothetical protein VEW26_08085, partial [Allosphingosinicella sp.]|nr:hypothetical protein [Allosphingosinicella sp.]